MVDDMDSSFSITFGAAEWAMARRYGLESALAYYCSIKTGSWWRFSDCGVGVETSPPNRSCIVDNYKEIQRLSKLPHEAERHEICLIIQPQSEPA